MGLMLIQPFYLILLLFSPLPDNGQLDQWVLCLLCHALILLQLVIDALSHTDFSFLSENPFSESGNANKILHNLSLFLISYL